jgi:WD40 repeat protein
LPKITGHKGRIIDLDWNPFNDKIIATGSEDCTVKV